MAVTSTLLRRRSTAWPVHASRLPPVRRYGRLLVATLNQKPRALTPPLVATPEPCEGVSVDLRDLLDPGRDARLEDDLTAVEGALDALPKLADAWEHLPPARRLEYTERWLARMLTLESLPGRLFRGKPTLLQQARYARIVDLAVKQQAVMLSLGLHSPQLP